MNLALWMAILCVQAGADATAVWSVPTTCEDGSSVDLTEYLVRQNSILAGRINPPTTSLQLPVQVGDTLTVAACGHCGGATSVTTGDCLSGAESALSNLVTISAPTTVTVVLSEDTTPPAVQCADGVDNDLDGLTDLADPGCVDSLDDDETDPVGCQPTGPGPGQCTDGVDNDCDGLIDRQDPQCTFRTDQDESQ